MNILYRLIKRCVLRNGLIGRRSVILRGKELNIPFEISL